MSKNKCLNCTERYIGCHDNCESYLKFKAERELISKNRYILNYIKKQSTNKSYWKVIFIKNKFEKISDYSILHITKRNGDKFQILIDTEDIDLLKDYSWHVAWNWSAKDYYACYTKYFGTIDGKPKYKAIFLHRLILNIDNEYVVDHINHNTLDNRKSNLRVTNGKNNVRHRSGKNSNNTSGYRNVSWNNYYQKWIVQLQIDGKNVILGKFDDVDEAGEFAKEMREKYYGEFAGKN